MESVLVLECSETYHVVATPVFVYKLAATLVEDVLQCRCANKLRSVHIATYLVEKRLWCVLVGLLCATQQSLCLGKDDVGIAEDWHVVALVALVRGILVGVGIELQRTVTLAPTLRCCAAVELLAGCLAVVFKLYLL